MFASYIHIISVPPKGFLTRRPGAMFPKVDRYVGGRGGAPPDTLDITRRMREEDNNPTLDYRNAKYAIPRC